MNRNLCFPISRSDKQVTLERQGCMFNGQEFMDNHEIDVTKKCYCGRPNKTKKAPPGIPDEA